MWYLKFKYKHSDCIYAPKLKELDLNGFFYHANNYTKGNFVYTSAIIRLVGDELNIKRYVRYLKNHKAIVKIEVYDKIMFVLAKHKRDVLIYEIIYNPALIYPAPAYMSKEGFEIIEVASWERKAIENLISSYEKSKTTEYFEILQFKDRKMDELYISRLLPKLPPKQKEAITLAFKNKYYSFPRKINLDELAKFMKVSKQTFRENLRKAEAKIIPTFISE